MLDRRYPTIKNLSEDKLKIQSYATSIAFVENQPSPSLISLSPLTNSLSRTLRRSRIRPLRLAPRGLLLARSLGFGCDRTTHHGVYNRLADPLYKRNMVALRRSIDCSFLHLNAFNSISKNVLFQPSFTVLVFYRSPYILHIRARIPIFSNFSLPTTLPLTPLISRRNLSVL